MTDITPAAVERLFSTKTTLNEIRAEKPCRDGWEKLLAHLGKTKADDEPLELLTILESNGFDDALWCLRVKSLDRLSRHFQAWCADQVLHQYEKQRPDDMRIRDQIAMLRNDTATNTERDAARSAALEAAGEAKQAATQAAAWAAAWAATEDAARDAAGSAAGAVTWAATQDTARAFVRGATRAATWDAAWDAERDVQEKQLRKMIGGEV
jgi:hypothetical protein